MKDLYEKYVKKNVFSIRKIGLNEPLVIVNNLSRPRHLIEIKVSSDNFGVLLEQIGKISNEYFLIFYIYDEGLLTQKDIPSRIEILKKLNELNIYDLKFYLSDDAFGIYDSIFSQLDWKHSSKTTGFLSLDRNRKKEKDNLHLENFKGNLLAFDEERLVHLSPVTLNRLRGKVPAKIIDDSLELKKIIKEFYIELNRDYEFESLNDFEKSLLAYEWVKNRISFASEYVCVEDGRQALKLNYPTSIREPLGTFKTKKGVCEGQARLISVLLNNSLLNVDSHPINGDTLLGPHAWVGVNIQNRIYNICPTIFGPFKSLEEMHYTLDAEEIFPFASLSNQEIKMLRLNLQQKKRGKKNPPKPTILRRLPPSPRIIRNS